MPALPAPQCHTLYFTDLNEGAACLAGGQVAAGPTAGTTLEGAGVCGRDTRVMLDCAPGPLRQERRHLLPTLSAGRSGSALPWVPGPRSQICGDPTGVLRASRGRPRSAAQRVSLGQYEPDLPPNVVQSSGWLRKAEAPEGRRRGASRSMRAWKRGLRVALTVCRACGLSSRPIWWANTKMPTCAMVPTAQPALRREPWHKSRERASRVGPLLAMYEMDCGSGTC